MLVVAKPRPRHTVGPSAPTPGRRTIFPNRGLTRVNGGQMWQSTPRGLLDGMNTLRNLADTQPDRDTSIDVYHAAFVAGGTRRMVDVAIAHLALRNQILVSRHGQLTAVQGAQVSGAVETAVYRTLTPTASGAAVYQRLDHDPDIEAVAAAYSADYRNRGDTTHRGKLTEELAGVAVFGFGAVVDPLLRSALTSLGSASDASARWWDSGGSDDGGDAGGGCGDAGGRPPAPR